MLDRRLSQGIEEQFGQAVCVEGVKWAATQLICLGGVQFVSGVEHGLAPAQLGVDQSLAPGSGRYLGNVNRHDGLTSTPFSMWSQSLNQAPVVSGSTGYCVGVGHLRQYEF